MNVNAWLLAVPLLFLVAGGIGRLITAIRCGDGHHHHHSIFGHKHGEAALSIDIYAYQSKISHWSPYFKVFFSLILLLMCVIADNLYVSLTIICITTYVTVFIGGMPLRRYLNLMTIPITFLVVGSIVILLNFSTQPLAVSLVSLNCGWFYITITQTGLHTTLNLWGKAFGAVSAMYMMSLSTMSGEIFTVLRRVRVPKLLIELMNMIYRFIFIMLDTQSRMKNSAQSRLGYVDFKTSIYSFGSTASNLLIVSLKRSSSFYDAMESRCYDGDLLFLEQEKPMTRKQLVWGGVVILYLIAIWIITNEGVLSHV